MQPMLIETRDLGMSYGAVRALDGVCVEIARGEFVAIMGRSGSGKSTFMNLLGCLDRPSAGSYHFDGIDVTSLDDNALAGLRNRRIGFVFQSFRLLARASALENVALPLMYAGQPRDVRSTRARTLLETMGLGDRLDHTPAELSGGQQQRVAIARALANSPTLILADEPTGSLDTASGAEIMDIFDTLNRSGFTIVVVTHDETVARRAHRILHFQDGRLTPEDGRESHGSLRLVTGDTR
jgi:putative ABC transport system ATP-binding protein